ncbi:hypothetical protein [Tenggerimyces flavus]|uniref:Uncharacterized protein n=1 Tax=Tenggerimyces flavus TaxID=1708749 RepID=A0ABV7Y9K3_9ACTN|nr:hypothetical protein [Tenggerimyces flavus]MBM7788849.1 hypothetical protein [Tenggerimyces flavus]
MADGTLSFTILAKDAASKTFHGIGKAASGLGKGLASVGKAGALGLAAVGVGVVALGPQLLDAAAKIQLMENKSKIVFGDQIGRVKDWAEANAHAMGLTKREAVGLAAGMADLLVPMGFTRKTATDMTLQIQNLSGALSEWSGGTRTTAEVSEILQAALLGERDALQGLGIGISQAQVDAQILANKKKGLTFATEEQASAQATLDLVMQKSTDAQNAYAQGAGSLARKVTESKARLKEMGDTLLVTATPALVSLADIAQKKVLPALEKFVAWLSGPGKFQVAAAALGMAESFLAFAGDALASVARMARGLTSFTAGALTQAGMLAFAMGKKGLAGKLFEAAGSVESFGQDVAVTLEGASNDIARWNSAVRNMKDKVELKAKISDLEQKLASAKKQLNDKSLTKDRRAAIKANIAQLTAQVRSAKRQLNSIPDERVNITVGVSISGANKRIIDRARAHGGPVDAGVAYTVGERGPETFVPDQDGLIVPNGGRLRLGGQGMAMAAPVQPAPVIVQLANHGVIGSKIELLNWLTAALNSLRKQGRLA